MTYNEFVNKPLRLRRKVEHKIEEVRLKETACMSATAPLQERIQNSVNNTTELAYVSYADAKRILGELLAELDAAQNELREFLYGNLHFNEADLLEWRYADGKSLHEIAELQHITYDAARTRASRAEKNARKAYNRHTQQQNVTL